jgi:hypothetical protein
MIKKKVLFIHIPKSGGTSIASAIIGKPSGHPYLYEYYLANKNYTKTFYKFCVVRNPYDRAVSSFNHIYKNKYNTFLDFVKNFYYEPHIRHNDLAHKRAQIDFLRDKKGNLVVDNIIKFENLNSDFDLFKLKYNIECKDIPHIGKQTRTKKYNEIYCNESKRLISEYFKEDIEIFNYKF